MESSKMYCPSRCRYRAYHCVEAKYPVSWGVVQGPEWKYAKLRSYQSPWYSVCIKTMVISKGSYGHGEFKNVLPQSVQIPYLPLRGSKVTRFNGGSIGPRMEICEISALPIYMISRLHQSNGYIKRKLRAWRVQKCIALVGADTVLTSWGPETTPFQGKQYRAQNGNMRNFGPTNTHGTAFAPKQWLYQKEATGMESSKMYYHSWCRYRTYHCVAAKYPVSWGQYRAQNGNMRNFGPTNPNGTAFVLKQWLYQKEATGMESSKMYCPSRCRYRTYHCVEAKYPVSLGVIQGQEWKYAKLRSYQSLWYSVCIKTMVISKGSYGYGEFKNVLPQSVQIPYLPLRGSKVPRFMGGSIGPRMEICETSVLPIPMVQRLHQNNGYIKRKLRAWRVKKCIALVGADTVLTTAWKQSNPFHGGQYRAQNGNMRNFGPSNLHDIAFAPKQWLY